MPLPDLSRVGLIFSRELRDALRDRRTVFMVLVLPILLYPALMLGGLQLAGITQEADRRKTFGVMVAGIPVEDLHKSIEWSRRSDGAADPKKSPKARPRGPSPDDPFARLRLVPLPKGWKVEDAIEKLRPDGRFDTVDDDGLRVTVNLLVVVTKPFEEIIESAPPRAGESEESAGAQLVFNGRNADAITASADIRDLLETHRSRLFSEALRRFGAPRGIGVLARRIDFSDNNLQAGTGPIPRRFLGTLAMLLVIMSLTGAFYPAIDTVPGERERGTMETLLISPVTRLETVLGKFCCVWAFSATTAVVNLLSLGLTFWYVTASLRATMPEGLVDTLVLDTAALGWVFVVLLPLSAFFAAAALAMSTFARSVREGQYYLSPLFLIVLPLTMPVMAGETPLTPFLAQVPVLGITLALKEMLLAGPPANFDWPLISLAFFATFIYAVLSLLWAVRLFSREQVMGRDSDEFSPLLWIRSRLRVRRVLPRAGDVVVLFTFCLAGYWFIGVLLTLALGDLVLSALLMQLTILLVPTLGFALLLRGTAGLDLRQTFRLNLNRPGLLLLVPPMALASVLLTAALAKLVNDAGWLPVPAQAEKGMAELIGSTSIWVRLAVFALTPAICEELLCRGFLMSGLLHDSETGARRNVRAVVVSSILFGALHLLGTPIQVLYATLLGLVIGWLVMRTGSLLFGVVFHLSFNALGSSAGDLAKWDPELLGVVLAEPTVVTVSIAAAVLALLMFTVHRLTAPRSDDPAVK